MSISTSDAATPPDISPKPRNRWLALAVIAVSQLLIVLDATIVNIALPTAQVDLNISDADRQWMITAYALAFGGLLLLGGRIADFTGRKRAFIIGLLGFAGASALGGLATNAETLFAARALQGAFGALMAPAALSLLTVTFTEAKERARAFGVYGAIAGGGGAIGLLLGGVLTEYASWRWTLLVGTPIAIVAALAAVRFVDESRAEGNTRYDLPGAFTSTAGLVALVYGFTKASEDGWGSAVTVGWLIAAAVLLVAFVVIELRSSHPLLPMRVILDRNRGGAYISALLIGSGLFGMFLFLTFYLQLTLGYSALMTGVAFLPFTLGIIAGAGFSAQLQTRVGPRVLMFGGLLLAAIGMVMLTQIGVDTGFWTHVFPAEVVLSFGMGVTFGPMSNTALVGVAGHDAGVASALINTAQQIGGSLGTALLNTIFTSAVAGYLADHRAEITSPDQAPALQAVATVHSYTVAFWVSAALIGVAALVAVILVRAGRDEVTAHEGAPVAI
ncbi:MFS transporter [Paractinoplanes abujensis]|uniref:EmrB/QacA subfamily drug resistance transporter n=1 Tax=Paractinoplanes abujensis TaxID=882441 RepID=A0A7W7G6U6_9ACTN|nr:MFS transporter [Actinoplanes abujensis]MBB4698437.1 EmrB/QacA subfamily drug resistance transporter [Actinoplanes abujensis]GID19078.1 MFS transporter [Actinoplanes abujensis]